MVLVFFLLAGCSNTLTWDNQAIPNGGAYASTTSAASPVAAGDTTDPDELSGRPAEDIFGKSSDDLLIAHFLDVGQADSIIVELPNGENLLVDAGNNDDSATINEYLDSLGIDKIDYAVGTHPHEDHIGSLDNIIYDFDVGTVYMPLVTADTKSYKDVVKALEANHIKVLAPEAGSYMLDTDKLAIRFLAPQKKKYDGINDYSIVLRITYGDTSFLFMGDSGSENEMELLEKGYDVRSDLLKVGHHGSSHSTSATFLKAVKAGFAIISLGSGNDYGYPANSTLKRLDAAGTEVFRTDTMGTLIAVSDGENVTIIEK